MVIVMSDDSYLIDSIRENFSKTTHEKLLQMELHQKIFGYRQGDIAQLVKWPEEFRGVPNTILRSALFGAVGRGARTTNIATRIASYNSAIIMHGGPQLDQADFDVWQQSLHYSRTSLLGHSFEVSAYSFLKAIGRDTGKSQREWLKESFKRLLNSTIEIKDGSLFYAGHLIQEYMRDEKTGLYYITINPKILRLYGEDNWTLFELKDRLALKGHPLALWLHGFYSTHAKPYPLKIETIHKLCGSRSKKVTDFKKDIIKAFAFMNTAIGWKGEINTQGLVTMNRPISRAQQRHLRHKLPD
jgi:hypothetical protein